MTGPRCRTLVVGFNASTHQAELASSGCAARPTAPDGRSPASVDAAVSLKDDLALLIERGDRLADRLDVLVRAGTAARRGARRRLDRRRRMPSTAEPRVRSQAERDLLKALRMAR